MVPIANTNSFEVQRKQTLSTKPAELSTALILVTAIAKFLNHHVLDESVIIQSIIAL